MILVNFGRNCIVLLNVACCSNWGGTQTFSDSVGNFVFFRNFTILENLQESSESLGIFRNLQGFFNAYWPVAVGDIEIVAAISFNVKKAVFQNKQPSSGSRQVVSIPRHFNKAFSAVQTELYKVQQQIPRCSTVQYVYCSRVQRSAVQCTVQCTRVLQPGARLEQRFLKGFSETS